MTIIETIKSVINKFFKKRCHWYLFYFFENQEKQIIHSSTACGFYQKNKITTAIIEDIKKGLGLSNNALPVSVSYLGYMTVDEYKSSPTIGK